MGRGKIDIRRIENSSSRKVTFSKRRVGLVKKAQELSILCDAQVGLLIVSPAGKLFEYSNPSMMEIIERYRKCTAEKKLPSNQSNDGSAQGVKSLQRTVEAVQSTCKYMRSEDIANLDLKALYDLEQQLSISLSHIRSRKDHVIIEQFEDLVQKGNKLQTESKWVMSNQTDGIQTIPEVNISSNLSKQAMQSPVTFRQSTQDHFEGGSSGDEQVQLLQQSEWPTSD